MTNLARRRFLQLDRDTESSGTADEALSISSAVLRVKPARLAEMRTKLESMPGVEIHAATDDGRIVVTIESTETAGAADTYVALNTLDGVLSANLIYQYCDDTPGKQEIEP